MADILGFIRSKLSDYSNKVAQNAIAQKQRESIQAQQAHQQFKQFVGAIPRPLQKLGEGFVESSTLGLYDAPIAPSTTGIEKLAYGVGSVAGILNPFNPINKLGVFAKLGNVGSKIATAGVSAIAPKLIAPTAGKVAGFIGRKALPAIGAELAQVGAYAGAKKALGQEFDPVQSLAFGLGIRGLAGGAGSALKLGIKGQAKLPITAQVTKPTPLPSPTLGVPLTQAQETGKLVGAEIIKQKIRGFPQTIIKTAGIPKAVKDFAKTQTYEPLSNKTVLGEVSKIIKKGEAQAVNFAKKDDTVIGNATAMVMISKLIGKGRIDEATDLVAAVSPRFTQQGQGIQILSLFGKLSPTGALRWSQKLIETHNKLNPNNIIKLTPANAELIVNRAKALENLANGSREKTVATAKLVRDIAQIIPPSTGQRISTIQTLFQLLNPKTVIRNLGGNAIFGVAENISDVVGTGVDIATSVFTKKRTKVLPSLSAQYHGAVTGAKEGITDVAEGIDTSGGLQTKFDLPTTTFTGKFNPLTHAEKLLNLVLRVPDRAAFKAVYEGSLNNQMRAAGVTKSTPEMIKVAYADGLYRTFQDSNKISEAFTKTKAVLNLAGTPDGKFGLGDLILKYPRTPANLLARGLDYSPVGFLRGVYTAGRSLITGQSFDQKTFVERLSRGLVGTGLIAVGYMLAKNGVITGRPTKDQDITAAERQQGTGPFRFNIDAFKRYFLTGQKQPQQKDDSVVTFDWAQPLSISLAMGANMDINPKGTDWFTAGIEQLDAGAATLTEQPLLKGVLDFGRDINQYGPVKASANTILAAPSSFVPTISNQIVQTTDNTLKETYDPSVLTQAKNKIIARIPFLEADLPPKIGTLGKPLERYQNESNNFFNVYFNPSFMSKISDNPTAKEVLDIFERSGETQQAPRIVDKKIKVNGQDFIVPADKLGDYQTYVGQRADQAIQFVMNDPLYKNSSDADKAEFISKLLSNINSAAKIEIFGDQPNDINKNIKSIISGSFSPQLVQTPQGGRMGVTLNNNNNLSLTDTTQALSPPILTGSYLLDKTLISNFKGQITTRANDISDLYATGKYTIEEATRELAKLEMLKAIYGIGGTKSRKIGKIKGIGKGLAKIKGLGTLKTVKLKTTKLPKPKRPKLKSLKIAKPKRIKLKTIK